MTASPKTPDPSPLAASFAARFTALIAELIGFIALRLGRHPKLASLTPIFCNRLNRAARIIRAAMERLAQGRRPRVANRRNRIRTSPRKPRVPLPTAPGWLLRELKHEAALTRARLESLLAEPGIAELLAEAPTLQRLLNPIRRALGIGHEPRPPRTTPAIEPPPPQSQPEPAKPRARFIHFVRTL